MRAIGRNYKVHLDGYNMLPLLTGETDEGPAEEVFYFSDDGDLTALRSATGRCCSWSRRPAAPCAPGSSPSRRCGCRCCSTCAGIPYERAYFTSNTYYDWLLDRVFLLFGGQATVAEFLQTFQEYPPRQKAASFTIDQVMEQMERAMMEAQQRR